MIGSTKKFKNVYVSTATIYNTSSINLEELEDIVLTDHQSAIVATDLVVMGPLRATKMKVSGMIAVRQDKTLMTRISSFQAISMVLIVRYR